ncbi:FtsK/SpoIIIE domain-containing protein [Nocardiopsis sp. N85]|uniref:FtsK/SpoIIIE domain-containing protein n=1 Tax=Nocardiopsis sp. N85 TaxID=3029400 RepID=UPI00237F1189|nr:FtsK/SpoIIIE domain-containing protein [Nocardiopsis sp. N85]MDE3724758.1 FtsK/SpoIIIE domain-containing protein [Nocardiopsis sp. N85]
MSETTRTHRHLRVVPDDPTEDIPTGVTWDADTDPTASADQESPSAPGTPLEATYVYTDTEPDGALTPAQATKADLTDRLKASISATHTYALFAWSRRWETSMGYVMDPALRQEMIDAADEDLDQRRRQAAKKAKKALTPEDQRATKRTLERLERRTVSELEVDARVLRARAARLAGRCAIPAAVIVGPVLLAASGVWAGLLIWPLSWGWLALQGRALARAEAVITATPVDDRTLPATPAPTPAPRAARGPSPAKVLGATPAETAVIQRLDPAYWAANARERGLDGLEPDTPTLGVTGISVRMRLGGKWTPATLRAKSDTLKAMLALPEGAGVQVMPGETGDLAVVRIRTRTPDIDVAWNPDRVGIGIVPETGRVVDLNAYGHRVVAGVTGAGKSTGMRPWMASVVLNPLAALVFVDPKGQEAGLWEHCARTVKGVGPSGYARMYVVINEVVDELQWRQEHAEGTDWVPTEDHPELVLAIDEGAALVRMSKEKEYRDVLTKIEYIASQGRAGKVWIHWATQYPTKEGGIPAQVVENIVARLALHTASPQADRVVFDEQATATGWTPSELDLPGWGMLRVGPKDVPEHIRLWYATDAQVQALPARTPWNRPDSSRTDPAPESGEAGGGGNWIGAQGAVIDMLRRQGPRTLAQIDAELDFSKSMIDRALKELQAAGRVAKTGGYGSAWKAL